MKDKIMIAIVSLILIGIASSCNKDDKDGLAGTRWRGQYDDNVYTLLFTSESSVSWTHIEVWEDGSVRDGEVETFQCAYKYNKPSITIIASGDGLGQEIKGVVDGNVMTLDINDGIRPFRVILFKE